jgi:nitrite reductase (NADH) small subunit
MPPPNEPPADKPQEWVATMKLAELPAGAVAEIVVGEAIVALINVDGELFALDGMCSHQGGPLGKGRLDGCTLTCPWHGWQYDARTGKQLLSETIRQRRYATRIEGDTIWVAVDSPT